MMEEEERRGGVCRWKQTGERALNRRLWTKTGAETEGSKRRMGSVVPQRQVSVLSRLPSNTYRFKLQHICTVTHQSAHLPHS